MALTKILNDENKSFQPVLTDKLVYDTKPTVNSFNGITSDAVARAIAGASGEVPAVTESDNGKVLTAVYDEGGAAVEWADAQGGTDLPELTGNAGKVLKVNSGATGVEWANDADSDSNFVVTTSTKNDELIAAYTAGKLITAVRDGETYLLVSHEFEEGEHSFFFRSTVKVTSDYYKLRYVTFNVYAVVDSTATVTFGSTTNNDSARVPVASSTNSGKALMSVYDGEDGYAPSWQNIRQVPAVGSSDNNKVLKATYSGGSGSFAWADAPASGTVDQTYNASSTNAQSGTAVAGALATVNQVPASTSADEDKVLTVDSNGDAVWAAAQGGGGGSSYTFSAPLSESSGTVSLSLDSATLETKRSTRDMSFDQSLQNSKGYAAGSVGVSGTSDIYVSMTIPISEEFYGKYAWSNKTILPILIGDTGWNSYSNQWVIANASVWFEQTGGNFTLICEFTINASPSSPNYPTSLNGTSLNNAYYLAFGVFDSASALTTRSSTQIYGALDNTATYQYGSPLQSLAVKVPVPSFNTTTDVGKVLTVTANGLAWVTPS